MKVPQFGPVATLVLLLGSHVVLGLPHADVASSEAFAEDDASQAFAAEASQEAFADAASGDPFAAGAAHPESDSLQQRWKTVTVNNIPSLGAATGRSIIDVEAFNGIPFADAPVGPLRLRPPRPYSGPRHGSYENPSDKDGSNGKNVKPPFDATRLAAPSCPQMFVSTGSRNALWGLAAKVLDLPILRPLQGQEDCLTLDVQRPAGTPPDAKLPVLFWIFGGAFELGGSSLYDASSLLRAAVKRNQPFIFVAINHRVGGFGFLPGKEVKAAGAANLGLLDQRLALEWVADNIASFGGDPDRVTIAGLSSGGFSVLDQMVLYGGNATSPRTGRPLFRAAIINSGGAAPADPVDCAKAQDVYDTVVREAGCASAGDSLECLRGVPYDKLHHATNSLPAFFSYSSVALSYVPRPDGVVFQDSPEELVESRRMHPVPLLIGNQEDEGTILALFQANISSAADTVDWLADNMFHRAPREKLREFVDLYEPSLLQGSPHRTGLFNELYPGFKRNAAVLGDMVFTLSRRVLLHQLERHQPQMPTWSYLASYDYGTPFLGTFHGSDVLQVFFGLWPNHTMRSARSYYFNFIHNMDPNVGVGGFAHWPQWKEEKKLLWFRSPTANGYLADDFRSSASTWLDANAQMLHI